MATEAPQFTLANIIRSHATRWPDRPALSEGSRTLSFADLDHRSSQVAQAMLTGGVGPGDRVAVIARNCLAYYEVMLAVSKLGAVLVGINFRLAAAEVASVIADAAPRLILVGDEFADLVEVGPKVLPLGSGYETWLVAAPDIDPMLVSPDDVVLQLYSSGTTGSPKGAMLTNAGLSWTVRMGCEVYEMGERSVNLLTSPLFHVGGAGYSLTAFGAGGHTVISASLEPEVVLQLLEAHDVTHAFLVPTVIRLLLDALARHPTDLSSLELIAYGAAPIDDLTLVEAIEAFGSRFLGVYGMTETAGSVTALAPEDHDPQGPRSGLLRSVGRPLAWHDVRVFDPETTTEAPAGVVGEIWVRSPQNMVGYWRRPDLDAVTLRADGWLRTGDAAWRDEDGYLYIHDRLNDMIISGGENIYPAEVERVLSAHPTVREVVAIGVPHARWGETVKAIVVSRPAMEVTEAELISFCRERLAHYKCPTSVDFVDRLERNASGKVLKRVMREPYWRTTGDGSRGV